MNATGLVLLDETQRQQLNLHDQPPARTRHVLYRPTQSTISSTEEDSVETYSLRRTVPQSRSHARSSAVELWTDFTTADQQCGWTPQSRRRQSLESDILTLDEHVQANHAIGKISGLHLSASHMMIGVAIGFVVGIVLSLHDTPPLVVQWLSMPGELFLRALKALIMPYVFCAVAVGISDMINVGKFSKISWLTIRVFLTFWLSTAALGVGIAIGSIRPW